MLLSTRSNILDHNSTIVSSNSDIVTASGNSSGALGVGQVTEGGSTTSLGLLSSVGDLEAASLNSLGRIPDENLVVISGGVNITLTVEVKTPNFTFVMGVHDLFLCSGSVWLGVDNSTVSETNNHVSSIAIDGSYGVSEVDLLLNCAVRGSNKNDVTVFTTRVESSVNPSNGADETLTVGLNGLCTFTAFPLVDE